MDKQLTVVIPVYNTEKELLQNCLNSVLNQTYRKIEVILVDDGSVEETHRLCDDLSAVDDRIQVIHQKNSGASAARNTGTAAANGDYIMYVDSDDILADDAVEEGLSAISLYDADFVFAGLKSVSSQSEFSGHAEHQKPEITVFSSDKIEYIKHVFITQRGNQFKNIEECGYINRGPYARIIRTAIAKEVLFDPLLKLGEDVEWNMRILSHCRTVCFVNSIWYGYVFYESSSLHKYYGNRDILLANYHNTLYSRNIDYFQKHIEDYAINMATSFLIMIRSEFLFSQCPLSERDKRMKIKEILRNEPWILLTKKEIQGSLSKKQKILIRCCQLGCGVLALRLWDRNNHR